MDAEIRAELAARIRLLSAELRGELLRDVAARVAAAEAGLGAQVGEVSVRVGELEALQLGRRVASLEGEARRHSPPISTLEGSGRRSGALDAAVGDATATEETKASACSETETETGAGSRPPTLQNSNSIDHNNDNKL